MEPGQPNVGVNKPSGIPRPASRLPVLRNRSSQILVTKQEEAVQYPTHTNATPKIQKRKSIAALTRPEPSGLKDIAAISKPSASRNNVAYGSTHASRSSISSRASVVRPSSRANQRKQPAPPTQSSSSRDNEEHHDQLSSLDGFCSASRSGSCDESPPELQEYVEPTEPAAILDGRKSSRPSLSDRTIESIQGLPSTPKDRRRSSFFSSVESPMGPPPRPSSSLSRNGSNGNSRPGTSDGNFAKPLGRPSSVAKKAPASAKPASRNSLGGFGFTPGRTVSSMIGSSSRQGSKDTIPPSPRSPSPSKRVPPGALPNGIRPLKAPSSSRTVAAKPSKPRPAFADTFGPAVRAGETTRSQTEDKETPTQASTPNSSKRAVSNPSNASSAALRQQIAAAKAAARKERAKHDSPQEAPAANGRDLEAEMVVDPFNQAPKDEKHILRNRVNAARMDGRLNIAAMGLKHIPKEVMTMYDAAAMEESKVNWAEVVDLIRLNAADNDIEELDDAVFPDTSVEDLALDDQTAGNQFGGLETLDLHGNSLQVLPMGLRRLERLTTLNLANNKLENTALDVISQIPSLKDLRLGNNALSGTLPTAACNLQYLETLDLQSNRLLVLPEALRELVSLKVLNISGNQLTALPMEALQELKLTELDASSNALIGSLFPLGGTGSCPTLQSLKVANNSLAALTFSESLELPQLRTLDVTNNHLTVLPNLTSSTELITLTAGDNKIAEFPAGFTTLRKLRNVNFTSNELRLLDPTIAKIESLESLMLAANPLRDKKFLTMSAGDIKQDLRARLQQLPPEDDELASHEDFHDARDSFSPLPLTSPTSSWTLDSKGTITLAGRGLSDSINDSLGSFLQRNEVKYLTLSSNKLTAVPPALWLAQDLRVLDLSDNSLSYVYLSDELELPSLQELKLSRSCITTLEPLMTQLQAPNLQTLNLTVNRLTGALPVLRRTYPALTTLLAGDNKFTSVSAEALRGLHTVNLVSNDIEQLPAEIGLLWDEGLKNLEIGSNAFRVPNYRVLEKGTEAMMRWLRDRIPTPQEAKAVVNGDAGTDDEVD